MRLQLSLVQPCPGCVTSGWSLQLSGLPFLLFKIIAFYLYLIAFFLFQFLLVTKANTPHAKTV